MIRPLLLSAALLATLVAPALAQNSLSSTQTPPSPGNNNSGGAQPTNSLPSGASTATRDRPGENIGTTRVGPSTTTPSTTPSR